MSLLDELENGLGAARQALFTLAPRPSGDPDGLRRLAAQVRGLVDAANTAGRSERAVPRALTFEGPAAQRFHANVGDVSESMFVAGRRLDAVADRLITEARKIEKAQHDHDRLRSGLEHQVTDLLGKIGGLAT